MYAWLFYMSQEINPRWRNYEAYTYMNPSSGRNMSTRDDLLIHLDACVLSVGTGVSPHAFNRQEATSELL